MKKRGNLQLMIILIGLILVVLFLLFLNFFRYYLEAKTLGKQLEEKNVTYYLPSEFAVIRIERGYFDADLSGIRVYFLDDSNKKYYYDSANYPDPIESKQYVIMKDELEPKVPELWDFSRVRQISFAFLFTNGRLSREVYTIRVNQGSVGNNFKGNCFAVNGSSGSKIACN